MYRVILWLAAAGALAALVYGFASTNPFAGETWSEQGMARFYSYTRQFAVVYLLFAIFLRRYIGLAVVLPVVALTIRGIGPVPFFSVLLLWVSCALLGRWIFRTQVWVLGYLGGLCVWALAIGALAHNKVHYAGVYLAIHAAILLLRRGDLLLLWRDLRDALRPNPGIRWSTVLGLGAFLYAFLTHWVLIWKPESGGDALAMHLTVALDFANNHVFTFDYRQFIWAVVPMGADYCYAAAAVMGGEYATRLLNFVMFGAVAYMIFRAAQRWIPAGPAYLTAALFVSAPLAQMVTGSLFVENFTAALSIGALFAIWEFHESRVGRLLCLCAFLLGSGVGWKLGGLAVAAGLLPFFLLTSARAWQTLVRPRWPIATAAALLFLVPAVLPYAKAYVLTGNPFFPFGNPWFTSPLIPEYLFDHRFHEPLTWRTLFDLTFYTRQYYEGQHGSFAFHYLYLLPLSLAAAWSLRAFHERSALAGGWIAALAIALTQPNARYFYPALALLMAASGAVLGTLRTCDRRLFQVSMLVLTVLTGLNVWFLPSSNWHHRDFYLQPLFRDRAKLEYLRSVSPAREVVPFLNATTGGILFADTSEIAGVRQPVYANNWHNLSFRKLIETSRSPQHLYGLVREIGIEHIVAQKQPRGSDRAASVVLFDLLQQCGEPEFQTESHVVLRMAANCELRLSETAPKFTTRVFPPGKYNDDDPRLTFLGSWDPFRQRFPEAYGENLNYSKRKDAEIRFEFEGSALIYGYTKAFNRGFAEIWIDGKRAGRLDQYSPQIEWQSTVRYAMSAKGRHSVAIRVTGEKPPASEDAYVDLDFFAVEP